MLRLMRYPDDDRKGFAHFLCKLVLVTTIMLLPLWVMLAFKWPLSNDMIFYAEMLNQFSSQLWHGDWYPRWLMQSNSGYGSPVFMFYSPLSFYLMSVFEWLAPVDPHGLGRLAIGMQLALCISGVASYRWLRRSFTQNQAQGGALLYAGFPSLIPLMYYAYPVAQLLDIAMLPVLLMAIEDMRETKWRGVPKLSFIFGIMCLIHLPSLVTFIFVPVAYCFFMAKPGERIRNMFRLGVSGVLAILLSAINIIPMMQNKIYIKSEFYTNGQSDYSRNIFQPDLEFGFCLLILPLIALYLEQPKATRRSALTQPARFWIGMLAFLLFLILPVSKWLWDIVTPLQYLQYPKRFYNPMLPGVIFLATSWLPRASSKHVYSCLFILVLPYVSYTSWETWFTKENQWLARPYIGIGSTREYQTRWMDDTHVNSHFLPSGSEEASIIQGSGDVQAIKWLPREIDLHADITSNTARLQLHRFYFPGWKSSDGTVEPFEHGLMSLQLSQGSHDVKLTLPEFAGEYAGQSVSFSALCVLLAWMWIGCKKPVQASALNL